MTFVRLDMVRAGLPQRSAAVNDLTGLLRPRRGLLIDYPLARRGPIKRPSAGPTSTHESGQTG